MQLDALSTCTVAGGASACWSVCVVVIARSVVVVAVEVRTGENGVVEGGGATVVGALKERYVKSISKYILLSDFVVNLT